ncbi:ABC transporter substrate-binding protein [Actinomadura flavalba]|uniref:ABC transporter substrate-binding protein n=1 Tax=Actinomadura flavalba TaxID=1120938 RepID=UPI00035E2B16|nr:ABC transporter substrate-binding protein [Actinomadura flavalba]
MRTTVPPIALAAAALLLAACGGGTSAGAGSPVDGGTLVYGVNNEPINLDPHASPQDVTASFARPVLDSLVALDAEGRVHPWLAKSWKISADQKTYTFRLRDDVTFSDGTKFDAEAVKANLEHIVAPATKSQLAASWIAPYAGTEVVGPHEVRVTFDRPHAPFLAALSTAYFGVQSPTSLRAGPEALARRIVGSGPFVLDAFTPGKGVTYHRNPDYRWAPEGAAHQGPARLAKLEFKVLREDSVRLGALTSGQVDVIASVPPANVARVRADDRVTVTSRQAPGGVYSYYLNNQKGPFTDVRLRTAFRDGIDFAAIVKKLYFGVYAPADSPLSPATPGYTKVDRKYDPQAAARLLDEAGYTARDGEGYRVKDGKRLTVRWPFVRAVVREQRDTLAQQVQSEAKKLGFDVQILDLTQPEYLERVPSGDYDIADLSWQRAEGDALGNLFGTASIPTAQRWGQNIGRHSDRELDGWLDAALATTDAGRRAALYGQVQRKVTAQAASVPVYVYSAVLGVRKRVGGLAWEAQAFPTFHGAWTAKP